jgi:hypothetical protein
VELIAPVTSSWFTDLDPEKFCRIGISRGVPRGTSAGYRRYGQLNPGPWFNSCKTPREFRIRYQDEILAPLNAQKVLEDLNVLARGKIPALLCFEPPEPEKAWCHRGLVAAWLKDTIGIEVYEVGHEHEGCGWAHPKHHPSMRQAVFPAGQLPLIPDLGPDIERHVGKRFRRGEPPTHEYEVVRQDTENPDHVVVRMIGGAADGREIVVPFSTVRPHLEKI